MKSLRWAVAIFLLCMAVSFWSLFMLNHYQETLITTMENAVSAAEKGDIDEAKKQVAKFEEMWASYDPVLTAIVRHHTIDDIEKTAAGLMPMLDSQELSHFYSEAKVIISLIEIMWKDEKVSVENFF